MKGDIFIREFLSIHQKMMRFSPLFSKIAFRLIAYFLTLDFVLAAPFSSPAASYKAHYKLSLGTVGIDSIVSDVEGTMTVEFRDACEGWTVQQNADVLVATQEGEEQKIKWNYVTWESKNGRLFRFNMRRQVDGGLEDDIRGVATIDPKTHEGKAVYEKPYYFPQKFSAKALFPTAHFMQLLKAAKASKKFLSCMVFDGSTLDGASEVNAFIGLSHPAPEKNLQISKSPLKFWPIRFAIYGPHNTGEGPDLESAQQILENGIPLEYTIDYGDFKIKGILEHYQLLKKSC